MYGRLGRRRATRGIADAHAREVPVEAHEGSCADFLRRHEQEASRVALGNRRERREFAACLFRRVADSRNIRLAIEVTASKGKAPGPDGIRESDLSNRDRWNLTRKIAEQFQDRDWTPGPVRTTPIPKTSGRGTRPIRVQNFEDRVHETAIRQIVQPFLDPTFLGTSLAFRPRKSREEALATVERLALDESRGTWIGQDLDNAFENVPHGRLLDSLSQQLFADDLLDLLHRVVANERGKGIRQGGPLSPLLLNGYLHTTFDLRWRRDPHHPPALRYADDILLPCRDRTQAAVASRDLALALQTPGFTLKHSPDEAISFLEEGQAASWIGFDIRLEGRTLGMEIARKSWRKLEDHLVLAHEEPEAPLIAYELILAWISQQGAAYHLGKLDRIYEEIRLRVQELSFPEIPGKDVFAQAWYRGYLRWVCARREVLLRARRVPAVGSARQPEEAATMVRGTGPTAPTRSDTADVQREVILFADGCCLPETRVGGWACVQTDPTGCTWHCRADSHPRTTNNRMELEAAIAALRALEEPRVAGLPGAPPRTPRSRHARGPVPCGN